MHNVIAFFTKKGTGRIKTDQIKEAISEGGLIWLDIEGPSEEEFSLLTDIFSFHPLAIEDSKVRFHLPKINDYGNYLFLIWHAVQDVPSTPKLETAEVDIFISNNYLVTIHAEAVPYINELREKCLKNADLMKSGTDRLLHDLLDNLVDEYFKVIDRISDRIDALEDVIFKESTEDHIKELFVLKHQMLVMRKLTAPERDLINTLNHFESQIIRDQVYIYFLDVYDHLIRILDLIDTARDVIGGAMDIYLSQVSNRLNEIMKKLTLVATVFLPLTLITGIYGMNFRNMPELEMPYFYFGVIIFMVVFTVSMFGYFKWKKWW
jgi:magnesium transporter